MLYTLVGRFVWMFARRKLKSRGAGVRSLAGAGLAALFWAGALVARRLKSR